MEETHQVNANADCILTRVNDVVFGVTKILLHDGQIRAVIQAATDHLRNSGIFQSAYIEVELGISSEHDRFACSSGDTETVHDLIQLLHCEPEGHDHLDSTNPSHLFARLKERQFPSTSGRLFSLAQKCIGLYPLCFEDKTFGRFIVEGGEDLFLDPCVVAGLENLVEAFETALARMRSREVLSIDHTKYQHLLDVASDAMYVLNADGVIVEVNRAACAMTGYCREELIGETVRLIDAQFTSAELNKILADHQIDKVILIPTTHKRKDGSCFPVEISTKKVLIESDVRYISFARDITDRIKYERSVNHAAELYKLRSMIADSFLTDKKSEVYETILEELKRHTGCKFGLFGYIDVNGDLVCPSISQDIWHDTTMHNKSFLFHRERWGGLWGQSLLEKRIIYQNDGFKVPKGHVELRNAISVPLVQGEELIGLVMLAEKETDFDASDKDHMLEISQFLTPLLRAYLEEEQIKDELLEAKDKAEAGSRSKDDFLAMMSHELRTPLNPIMGFAEVMKMELDSPPNPEYLDAIIESGSRMVKLIDSILSFNRLQMQLVELRFADFDLIKKIESIVNLLRGRECQNTIETDFSGLCIKEGITDPEATFVIVSDPDVFGQIVENLISNACKYTSNGLIFVRAVTRETSDNKTLLRVEVEDNGIGVPEEKRESIFAPFMQVDTSYSREYEGAGLGLAICRTLVQNLGGHIGLTPGRERGSIFWFEIPLEVSDRKNGPNGLQITQHSRGFLKPWKILVAEDQADNQRYIATLITKLGGCSIVVSDGDKALKKLEEEEFDLVLMDLRMPIMDGMQATRLIRSGRCQQAIPIIGLSAHQQEDVKTRALEIGMNAFLTKPVNPESLNDTIDRVLMTSF